MAEVRFQQVGKTYPPRRGGSGGAAAGTGAVEVLRQLDLCIHDGEFLVLVGPSGCGKSTLLRLLAGLESPSSGEIFVADRPVSRLRPAQRDVAMVFQSYALYPHLSVADNLALGLRIRGMAAREREARIAAVLELLQLDELRQRRPAQLSGGQRQRVALARALLRQPRLVLLDEPMSNLDAQLREELRPELRRLLCGGEQPVVYVTHDQQEAMGMADRIAVLRDGQLQQVGSARELYARPANRFVAAFLGRPAINLLPPEAGRQLGLRPEHLQPVASGGIPARLQRREWWGNQQLLWLESGRGDLRLLGAADLELPEDLRLGWRPEHELWFDSHSGERLAGP